MAAVRAGDRGAYRALVSLHLQAIHHYALRLLGDAGDAEDITQETFLRLWLNAGSWDPDKARLTTWLHRITHNLCIDHLRRTARLETGEEKQLDSVAVLGGDNSTSGKGHFDDQMALLLDALATLPEAQRSATMLCHHSGFSNREAADIMGVSVRALESLLARARRQLKKAVDSNRPDAASNV